MPEQDRTPQGQIQPAQQAPTRNGTVTASAAGGWPGTDPVESSRVIRGELGDPHLPFLMELPQRGPEAEAVGRSASLLVDLFADIQPHGWRLVERPGKEHRRAVSLLGQDLNALADVAGAEESPGHALKISLRGPLSLAANLHLHNGERALADAGARRELAQSLAAGVGSYISRAASSVPGARITVQVDEPEIAAILAGGIPTASGYRTLRSVASGEVAAAWQQLREAIGAAGADTVLALPRAGEFGPLRSGVQSPFELARSAGVQGTALVTDGLDARDWEGIAEAVENGERVWLGVLSLPPAGAPLPQVTALAEKVLRPWRKLGLSVKDLPSLGLLPAADLAGLSPDAARKVLARLTQTASALDQVAAEG
ncbi:hypothetical protein LJ753_13170 [Arthrobacter sp. zg-Y20]|uniref:hypothetical protein n=1 Tax=unclassified Arthrobacter TaxID=235627 RepID=UPI001D14B1E6|nr:MULTISPECIES: hypothetical protein [unclassified Arthrobacter]MCC3276818.1 hypothetical protein [Arthrobacter sp. zg-Y20]MDK1316978.1 hypothetical protein [Arthrobacter sp. zg.Y20]WIB05308.1 hypothetical protein QNO06_12300 [Arthrobacter sp. zg-Y20]